MIMADRGEYQPLRMEYQGKGRGPASFEILFYPPGPRPVLHFRPLAGLPEGLAGCPWGGAFLSQKKGRPYQLPTVYEMSSSPTTLPRGVMLDLPRPLF